MQDQIEYFDYWPYGPIDRETFHPASYKEAVEVFIKEMEQGETRHPHPLYWVRSEKEYMVKGYRWHNPKKGRIGFAVRAHSLGAAIIATKKIIPNALIAIAEDELIPLLNFSGLEDLVPEECFALVKHSLVDGLIALIADGILQELKEDDETLSTAVAESIVSAIEQPQQDIVKLFRKWIEEHNASHLLVECIQVHIPWALSVLERYQSAWGNRFLLVLTGIDCFSLLAPAIGMGVGPWDNFDPKDFGIKRCNEYPDLGVHELDHNAIFDLVLGMFSHVITVEEVAPIPPSFQIMLLFAMESGIPTCTDFMRENYFLGGRDCRNSGNPIREDEVIQGIFSRVPFGVTFLGKSVSELEAEGVELYAKDARLSYLMQKHNSSASTEVDS